MLVVDDYEKKIEKLKERTKLYEEATNIINQKISYLNKLFPSYFFSSK